MVDFFSAKLFNVKIMLAVAILCLAVQGCQNRADDANSDDRDQKEQTDSNPASAGIKGQTETETKASVTPAKTSPKTNLQAKPTAQSTVKAGANKLIFNGGFDRWDADGRPAGWRVYNGQVAKMASGKGVQLLPGDGQQILVVTQKIKSLQPLAGKTVKVVANGLAPEAGALSIQVQYYVGSDLKRGIVMHSGNGNLEPMIAEVKLPTNIDESKGVTVVLRLDKTAKQAAEMNAVDISVF